ncbi:MAG: hypothetical protein RIB60_06050 [Phycisphaerales bacterium]
MKNVKPLGLNVLVRPRKVESKVALPEASSSSMVELFEVLAVGPGTKDREMDVKVGDHVVLSKRLASHPDALTGCKVQGDAQALIPLDAILAVAEPDGPEDVAKLRIASAEVVG